MASVNDPLVALEEHWAVSTFGAEQRAALIAYADDALRALRSGATTQRAQPATEDLLALASAFDIAARERLDLDGLGSPFALGQTQRARRPARLPSRRARRERSLCWPPHRSTSTTRSAHSTACCSSSRSHTSPANRRPCAPWLVGTSPATSFPGDDRELRWDLLLLRRNVELWTDVLSGSGPSGLERAMEIVATIREERGVARARVARELRRIGRDADALLSVRALPLTEAATELLLVPAARSA